MRLIAGKEGLKKRLMRHITHFKLFFASALHSSKRDYLAFSRLNRYKIDREAVLSCETTREVERGQGSDGKSDTQRALCSRAGFRLRLDARPFCCNSGRIRFTYIFFPISPSPRNVTRVRHLGPFSPSNQRSPQQQDVRRCLLLTVLSRFFS